MTLSTREDEDLVGVSIAIPKHCIDLRVPAHTTVALMMASLVDKCKDILRDSGRGTEYFDGHSQSWHLEMLGQKAVPLDGTLAEAGVHEGVQLYLRKDDPQEVYPELIDDVAEFVSDLQTQQFPAWSAKHSRPLAAAVLLLCSALSLSGVVVFVDTHPTLSALIRYGIIAALTVTAMLLFAITVVCDYADNPETQSVPRWGYWLGYALTAAAAAICIPRPVSIYTIITVGIILATLSVVFYAATKRHPVVHVSIATAALLAVSAPLASRLYPWAPAVIAAQVMALGLVMIKFSPQIALGLAKINLPYIPATGETYIKNLKGDVSRLPLITSKDETLDSIFHQKNRVAASRYAILAVTVGLTSVIVAAAFFLGIATREQWWLAAVFAATMAIALVFRGQCCGDAAVQGAFWIAAPATVLAFLAGATTANGLTANAGAALGILTLVALLAVIVSVRQLTLTSIMAKKAIDMFELVVYCAPFLILGWFFMDLYHLFRAW